MRVYISGPITGRVHGAMPKPYIYGKFRGVKMNNFSIIKKMNEFELADFIYDVSEGYTRISTCKDNCDSCKKSEEEYIGLIKEHLKGREV